MVLAIVVISILSAGCGEKTIENTTQVSEGTTYAEPQTASEWNEEGESLYAQGKYEESVQAFDKGHRT
jgi:hypothetical protein